MPKGTAPEGDSPRVAEDEGERAVAAEDSPDDPAGDPTLEALRRAAFDAAMLGISDETLGDHVETLIAVGIRAWDLDEALARDLAQEAVRRVLEHRRKWDPRRGGLYPFLRGVLQSLVDHHFDSAPLKYEVHLQRLPDGGRHDLETDGESNVDPYENLAGPAGGHGGDARNAERGLLAQDDWDQDREDFRVVATSFAEVPDAMGVIRAAQKDIRDAAGAAAYLQIPVSRVYRARRGLSKFLRALYAGRDEKPRLARVPIRRGRTGARTEEET
jgi:DNA-directed RNA polymerase specialized sigma24 family protein